MSFKIKVFKNSSFKDNRGYYWTSWKKGIIKNVIFNHDKFSLSKKNVLRGLHGDKKMWKLVSCVYGKIFIAVVDLNKNSKSYLKWKTWILSQKNNIQLLVPPNYANGHYCLSDYCLFHYKLSYKGFYTGHRQQFSIRWNDPKIDIKWPCKKPILSMRDKNSKFL
mgnify:FL=1